MEFLNAQAKYIAEQVRGMTNAQRIAIGLLMVIIVGGMWGLVGWSRQGQWEPLLDQSFTPEQIQRVTTELALAGVEAKVEGDRVLIHGGGDVRTQLQALLIQRGAWPTDTSMGYAALVKDDNVWESDEVKRWKQNRALESELSAVISRFGGLAEARVLIVVPQRRSMKRTASSSTASVNVKLDGSETLDRPKIMAIASYVAGAVPGLEPKHVTITDGNRTYRAPDPTDALATNLLEKQRKQERHYAEKIYDQLKHVSGVVVNVHAKLRQSDERRQAIKLGEPQISREKTKSQESTGPTLASGPGVRPNTGQKLSDASTGQSSTIEDSETEFTGLRDEERIDSSELRGSLERLTASINVPRSYLVRILETQQAEGGDTSLAAVQKVAEVELPKIRDQIKPLIGATEADDRNLVVVDWYYDMPSETPITAAAAPIEVLALAKDYGAEAGLGLLAAFSLFMVIRIARKAQAVVVQPSAAATAAAGGPEEPLQALGGGPGVVGEVQEMEGVLVGHEVDQDTVRTQQIVNQIGQMVNEDPATAATIVEHWLRETD